MSTRSRPISPELALVDPELAAAARARLPWPPDCLAARPRSARQQNSDVAAAPAAGSRVAETQRARGRRGALRSALTAGAWLVLAGVLASPLLAFLPPTQAPSLDDPLSIPRPRPATLDGRIERNGPTIRWRPVTGASFYNLILVRGSERVDLWPTQPSARVARPERTGVGAIPTVSYSWYVYPGFTLSSGRVRYGTLVAHGAVAAQPGTLRSEVRPMR